MKVAWMMSAISLVADFLFVCFVYGLICLAAPQTAMSPRDNTLSLIQRWEGTKYLLNTLLLFLATFYLYSPIHFLCLKDTNPVKSNSLIDDVVA